MAAELFAGCTKTEGDESTRLAADNFFRIAVDAWFRLILVDAGYMTLEIVLATERAAAFRPAAWVWTWERLGPIRVRIVGGEMRVEVVCTSKGLVAFGTLKALFRTRFFSSRSWVGRNIRP